MKLCNAFSLNMLSDLTAKADFKEISLDEARALLVNGVDSAVGHEDTAAVFSTVLDIDIEFNRTTVNLEKGDQILVGQYCGPRLQEGVTILPEESTIKWVLVVVS